MLDEVVLTFEQAITGNAYAVIGLVTNMMYLLMTIDFVWGVLTGLLNGRNFIAFLVEKIMKYGIWFWLFRKSPELINIVADGFVMIGSAVGGDVSLLKSLSSIIDNGYRILYPLWQYFLENTLSLLTLNIGQFVIMLFIALILSGCFVWMAIHAVVTYIEFFVISIMAIVLLPFGMLNKTAFLAEKALGAVPSAGVKLCVLQIVLTVSAKVLNNLVIDITTNNVNSYMTIVAVCAICTIINARAPEMAAGLLSGSPSLSAGAAAGVTGSATSSAVSATVAAKATTMKAAGYTLAGAGAVASAASKYFSGTNPSTGAGDTSAKGDSESDFSRRNDK